MNVFMRRPTDREVTVLVVVFAVAALLTIRLGADPGAALLVGVGLGLLIGRTLRTEAAYQDGYADGADSTLDHWTEHR